jgi:hypothetical protein
VIASCWRVDCELLASCWRVDCEFLASCWRVAGQLIASCWLVIAILHVGHKVNINAGCQFFITTQQVVSVVFYLEGVVFFENRNSFK